MTEASYREYVIDWCNQLETNLNATRGQLFGTIDDESFEKWKERLFTLRREAEIEKSDSDGSELYKKATDLYDELTGFLDQYGSGATRQEDVKVQAVPIGGHRLPSLPYPYDSLEPVIAEEIMKLHHTKHHQSYVDGLNKAEREMQKARESGDFSLIKHWQREAAFHGSGHYLHTIFWSIMSPDGGGNPKGQLGRSINSTFGSFEKLKKHFTEAAKKVEAVGWAILVWSPRSNRLEILTAEKHQNLTQWGVIPLLVLDVWEHAYYLQYKNERSRYVENWWKVVNWQEVERRFNKAKTLVWQPY